MFKNMTLDELKTELEKRTEFRFKKKQDYIYGEILSAKNKKKEIEIQIGFAYYKISQKHFVEINIIDGYEIDISHIRHYESIDQIVVWLEIFAYTYFGSRAMNK